MSQYRSPTFKNTDSIHEYKESSSLSDSDDEKHPTSFSMKKKRNGCLGGWCLCMLTSDAEQVNYFSVYYPLQI